MTEILRGGRLSRRTVLRGLGTAVALPFLEAMTPRAVAAGSAARPMRMAFFYVPNGAHMDAWTPAQVGAKFDLPEILAPLAGIRKQVSVLSGLACDKARANGDGAGDHARSMAAFLTGCQARKTGGTNIRAGVSVDQIAASRLGAETRFPSLEMGLEAGQQSGSCDSGYACVYQHNLSWRGESQPMSKEIDPKSVFDRLFGSGAGNEIDSARARRDARRKSVLDFVREDATRLEKHLGGNDRAKLDEYLTDVREIEGRLASTAKEGVAFKPSMKRPGAAPAKFDDHAALMGDLLALAFQADLTRVATMVYANDGSNRNYPELDVREGHHELSHHGKDQAKLDKIKRINTHHMVCFARFLSKLQSIKDGDRTLLDRSLIVFGSAIGDGDRHNHDDLPILLAGGANGKYKPGRHVKYPFNTPLTNLYLAMLQRFGAPTPKLGDSTGVLDLA